MRHYIKQNEQFVTQSERRLVFSKMTEKSVQMLGISDRQHIMKAEFLWEMVRLSYDVACDPESWQLMKLSQLLSTERNPKLRQALKDLDEFMNGY